jgi:hypothetical protein
MTKWAETFFLLALLYLVVVTLPASAVLIAGGRVPFYGGIGFVVVWLPLAFALAAALGVVLSSRAVRKLAQRYLSQIKSVRTPSLRREKRPKAVGSVQNRATS